MPNKIAQEQLCFNKANILVVGDSALDIYWHSTTNRISPEAPVAVSHYQKSEYRLSGAAQIAAIINNLGGCATLLSIVGSSDGESDIGLEQFSDSQQQFNSLKDTLARLLDEYNVHYNLLSIEKQTNSVIRIVSQAQQLLRVDSRQDDVQKLQGQPNSENSKLLFDNFSKELQNKDTVIFYCASRDFYDKNTFLEMLNKCSANNIKTLFVASNNQAQDFITEFLTDNIAEKFDYIIASTSISKKYDKDINTISKLAKNGLLKLDFLKDNKELNYIATNDGHCNSVTTKNFESKNITKADNIIGVQEAVTAVFAMSASINNDFNYSLDLATSAMNLVLTKFGQVIVNIVELQLAYADYMLKQRYNLMTLKQEIQSARNQGKKIVFANGCFDVLHVGHVSYLDAARKRGDKLFVAVNSDYSISRLKGPTRPVNNLADRMFVLSCLECVDWVVPFYTDTPEDFLKWLKPDILVKGGDYTIDQVVGREIVYEYGGEVAIISHAHTDKSSTKIIARQNLDKDREHKENSKTDESLEL